MGKVLGYTLIIAIFVAVAYFLAVGKGGNKSLFSKKVAVKTQQEATASATPQPVSTKISIFAAGTPASGEYPTMELKIDGSVVQTWKGVKGDAKIGKFDEFTYNYPGLISGQIIQIGYTNDLYIAADEDRNLYVDRMTVGETTYVADSPATTTTITEKSSKKCTDGTTYSRWLLCNGYFTFQSYEKAFVPVPTLPARLLTGTVIKVYAAGKFVGGDYPMFNLNVGNKTVAMFKVAGDPVIRLLGEYTYTHPDKVKISDISIVYLNDYYSGVNDDRNLYIDKINVDGVDYPADGYSVYQTGVWRGNVCAEGYLRSKLLWCGGGSMRFGARLEPK